MQPAAAFGDILMEKLRNGKDHRSAPSSPRAGFIPSVRPMILDGEPLRSFFATPYGRMAGTAPRQAGRTMFAAPYSASVAVPPAVATSPAPRRTLSPRHQRALDALIGLGAALHVDFTETELRSAFRALARRFHPDRHPGSNAADSRRLAGDFARLADSYRELLPVTRTSPCVN